MRRRAPEARSARTGRRTRYARRVVTVVRRFVKGLRGGRAVAWVALLGLVVAALGSCKRQRPLPTLGTVPHLVLMDQSGRPFDESRLKGKVWAAAFFFTRCPSVCPKVTRLMHEVQIIAKTRGVPLYLVSVSVDPENDTPDVLRRYAEDYGADLKTWTFVTGKFDVIRETVEKGFKVAMEGRADPNAPGYGIVHGSHLVLVDRNLKIRGYYATSGQATSGQATSGDDEMGQLLVDADRLATR